MPDTINKLIVDMPEKEQKHYRLHLNAVLKDAEGIKDKTERERVIADAKAMIDGKTAVPVGHPCEVHDWIEKPDERTEMIERAASDG